MKKSLVILAAGIGSRYGGFKQMDPVGPDGEFIIDYSVYDAIRAGFDRVVFIIRRDIEQGFKDTIGNRVSGHIETAYTFQGLDDLPQGFQAPEGRTKPWGTVQAVLTCVNAVAGPFAVINADDFYGRDSYRVLSRFLDTVPAQGPDYAMVGFKLRNTLSRHGSVTRGICKPGKDGKLSSVVETSGITSEDNQVYFTDTAGKRNDLSRDELVSMNMWGFTPSVFGSFADEFRLFLQSHGRDLKQELVIPTSVNSLIAKGKASVAVLSTSSKWFGITYPDDRREVAAEIQHLTKHGEYPEGLWKGRL